LKARTALKLAGLPMVWLLLFFAAPFVVVLKISFAEAIVGQPPYTPLLQVATEGWHLLATAANYLLLIDDPLYIEAYFNSLKVAGISTLVCLLIGYPMAYAMARAPKSTQHLLVLMIVLPFWTSFLLRVYALEGIIRDTGLLNQWLLSVHLIEHPLKILRTSAAVYLGIIYSYLPFMILPLYATLEKMDLSLLEAAQDLGSRPWRAFWDVTLPLSMPGVIAGSMLVFIPAIGEYVIPALLGGPDNPMIGRILWDEFFENHDRPVAAAVSVAFLLLIAGPMAIHQYYRARDLVN